MSISYDYATIYAQIPHAKDKMMRLLGLFQQAGTILRHLIGDHQSGPMMRFLRAVSTTSLVTTVSWLATRTNSTCIIRRSMRRILPFVMRRMVAMASWSVKSLEYAFTRCRQR